MEKRILQALTTVSQDSDLRLRISQVDDKKIKSAGVAGVIKPGKNSVQVIIGTKVQFVADEFSKLCE